MNRPLHQRAIAFLTMASFLAGMLPRSARAQSDVSARMPEVVDAPKDIVEKLDPAATIAEGPIAHTGVEDPASPAKAPIDGIPVDTKKELPSLGAAQGPQPQSLPSGVESTGVSSQVISLPQGAGKLQGMGESFSNQLSTGTATYSIPIALPGARGGADPQLALTYSTSGGHGVAGVGWDIGVPFIARQTDRGNPLYQDPTGAWGPTQDRFVFNGGQELVPICLVSGTTCTGAQTGEVMPSWSSGWQYFRPRIEGSFLRIFWSPDHATWRVQDKNGVSMELGAPLDGTSSTGTTESDPNNPSHVFRWNLSRQYDAYGAANPPAGTTPLPVNVVRYAYLVDHGMSYLSDVYDTPPMTSSATAAVTTYAHHAHLSYEARPDATISYRRGWQTSQALRLTGVDVTSEPFQTTGTPRKLVRRYHLAYDPSYHVSLLSSVQVEGRCGAAGAGEANEPIAEDSAGLLPATTGCPTLPAMTFAYTHVAPYTSSGSPGVADLKGYEGFDERVTTMVASPPHSVDEANTDLFDVNADGLPDVLVTLPGLYNGQHGLYLNGVSGQANSFSATTMGVTGVLGESTTDITLDNPNISSGDIDGDGIIDLINMPQVKTYSVYTPTGSGLSWTWLGRSISTAAAQSPKINLGSDGLNIQRMDVNGDGLIDVVLSQGTEMETFFSLDRYPGGDGQFGNASWTGPTTALLSNDPVAACVPWDGLPVQLSDPTVKVADMNGDGLPDLVRIEQGNVHYWPGRGNGYWGTSSSTCPGGTFGENQYVAMSAPPEFANPDTAAVRVDDVNGDGLDDLVIVNFTTVEVYLNVDGIGWTAAHVISNAPASPAYLSRVRLADINGSGTHDILWGDGGQYRFMDLSGGARPWMLTHIENGLGKTTDIDYASSTSLMLAAQAAGTPWTSVAPMPLHVVTQMIVSDNLSVARNAPGEYITQYSYANPVYDGRQREFRGFTTATETRVGDTNSPTSLTQSTFLLGQCQDDEPLNALPSACTPAGRWRDNVREALKGLPTTVQSYDAAGVYLSTVHHTYRLRLLYAGADGREVRHAFESSSDTYLYDGAMGVAATPTTIATSDVELELTPPAYAANEETSTPAAVAMQQPGRMVVQSGAGQAHLQSASHVDVFGNTFQSIDNGVTGVDPVITKYAQPAEVSGNTGWLWRNIETYTVGTTDIPTSDLRDHSKQTFNAQGSPLATSMVLQSTLALARSNAGTGGTAPAPSQASKNGTNVVLTLSYDGFGNPVSSVAANDRCRSTTFDTTYATLPVTDTIDVGSVKGACGTTVLTTAAVYDQGLGVVTTLTDVRGETTDVAFDGFGRIAAIFRPDPVSGVAGTAPSMTVDYQLPTNAQTTPYSLVHTEVQDGADPTVQSYRGAWAYVDGLGRTVVTLNQADPSAGDAAAWIATGLTTFDGKGSPDRKYLDYFFASDPTTFFTATAVGSSYARQTYDAFGRPLASYALDNTIALSNVYHALSTDAWDTADLTPTSGHYGTFASTAKDGHGRTVAVTERAQVGRVSQSYQTTTTYESTGEPILITRSDSVAKVASVARWVRYDSQGRMVANVEPDTTVGFKASPSGAIPAQTWRYAYNDDGDLVGTSDARGCGANYAYDAGGRILSEDYSPCTADQAAYSATAEVTYQYDVEDSAAKAGIDGFPVNATWYRGRLASTTDRSGKTLTAYDGRGRTVGIARQLSTPTGALAPRWYVQEDTFDADDRAIVETTGAVDAGASLDVTTQTTTAFSKRSLISGVTSNQWTVITSVKHDADRKPLEIVYGDVAGTTTAMVYDSRRRLSSVMTYRGPPGIWTAPPASYMPPPSYGGAPSTFQLLLQDLGYKYDVVDNPVEIDDYRTASEWPAGAQPVTRTMQYDDLYRLTQLAYQYPGGSDAWTSPFAAEDEGVDPDPQRATPVPQVSFSKRILSQTFAYDWLGNTTATGDDVGGFYDRSLGTVANGTATAGPYQLLSATNTAGVGASKGSLTTAYDAAGNMTGLSVTRSGTCLPSGAICSQQYSYAWDEVGRLARARRWDLAAPGAAGTVPATTPAADLLYTYDATDDRAVKQATDGAGNERYTLYPLDALELRQTTWNVAAGDYDRTSGTEAPFLSVRGVKLGRILVSHASDPELASGVAHLLLELPDYLGSTSLIIDHGTSELVEASTYQPYGSIESDYRPTRWSGFREDYQFTGKEEDAQVGIEYFESRYLASALNRWTSADPLATHLLSADPNLYAYVHGRALVATDPLGLDLTTSGTQDQNSQTYNIPPPTVGQLRVEAGASVAIGGCIGTDGLGCGAAGIVGAYVAGGSAAVEGALATGPLVERAGALLARGVGWLTREAWSGAEGGGPRTSGGGEASTGGGSSIATSSQPPQSVTPSGATTPPIAGPAATDTASGLATAPASGSTVAPPSVAEQGANPSLLQKYLGGSGGRWGSGATRAQNNTIATELEVRGYKVTGGAGRQSEEWFAGPGGGTKGGTFVDITAKSGARTVRVQTVTTLADGVTPNAAEAAAAQRIITNRPNDMLVLIPKAKPQ